MAAQLGDMTAVQHRDPVRLAHGREPVRDHHRGEPGGQLEEPAVERGLGPHVELSGRLIQDEHPRTASRRIQRAGQRDPLPLPAGQVSAAEIAGSADRVPAARQLADQVERVRPRRRLLQHDIIDPALQVAEPHVLPRGQRVPGEVLVDHRDLPLPRPGVELTDVDAIDQDPSARRLTQPGEQRHQRCFASSINAHQRERMPGGQFQIQPLDNRAMPGRVLVADRLEPDRRDREVGRVEAARHGADPQPADDLVQVGHGREHLLQRHVGGGHSARLRGGREHRQHDRDRA